MKFYDVFLDSGTCVEVPDSLDPDNNPADFRLLRDRAVAQLLDKLATEEVDINYEPYEPGE